VKERAIDHDRERLHEGGLAWIEPAVQSNRSLSAVPVVGLDTVSAGRHGG